MTKKGEKKEVLKCLHELCRTICIRQIGAINGRNAEWKQLIEAKKKTTAWNRNTIIFPRKVVFLTR